MSGLRAWWGGRSSGARRPDVALARGERLLAWAPVAGGTLVASHDALHFVGDGTAGSQRWAWEELDGSARSDSGVRVRFVDSDRTFEFEGAQIPDGAERLLAVLTERVRASIVLSRRVDLGNQRGFVVAARQAPRLRDGLAVRTRYDEGTRPEDADVSAAERSAREAVRIDVGLDP